MPVFQAIERLSALAGLSIGGTVRVPPSVRSRTVRSAKDPATALKQMLDGTRLQAIKIDDRTYRIVAAPLAKAPLASKPALVRPSKTETGPDIVVVASKLSQRLATSDGNTEVVSFASPLGSSAQRASVSDLASGLPSLSGTRLGRGRDKLFLRGIADSSFAGKIQATLGEYLSEARINYSAPDPSLLLYDVRQVELLKGPQGTLYGGGTLSGVLRIEPEKPELGAVSGFVDTAASSTARGGPGYAIAGMINVPLVTDRAGIRLLGYRRREGGYIDDIRRRLQNVNRSTIEGLRAQARVKAGAWTIDLLATHQTISARDSNYAVDGLPPLSRSSDVAQPSSNRFDLLDLELHGGIGKLDLVSTTSITANAVGATYDATTLTGTPTALRDQQKLRAVNHETRVSRSRENGFSWVAGIAFFGQQDDSSQRTDQTPFLNLNGSFDVERLDAGAFAQGTLKSREVSVTAGLRTNYSVTRLRPTIAVMTTQDLDRARLRASPTVTIEWSKGLSNVSLSYRESWRAEGASITRYSGDALPKGLYLIPFEPDHIRVAAVGYSYRRSGIRPFSLQASLSGVDWDRIQSASLDDAGLVYVTNADNANFVNLDLAGSWRLDPALSIRAGASFTRAFSDSFFEDTSDIFGRKGTIPSVPDVSAFGSVEWTRTLADDVEIGIEGQLSYLGRSRLGLDSLNDLDQGGAVGSKAAVRLARGSYSASLEIENATNDLSSVFGYGNPLTVRSERQRTPQRPRTITLGLHTAF